LIVSTLLSREAYIISAVAAAILLSMETALRLARMNGGRKFAQPIIYLGYLLFAASVAIYIVLGFSSP